MSTAVRVNLDKDRVEQIIAEAATPSDGVIGLYRLLFDEEESLPDMDDIDAFEGFPRVNEATGAAILELFKKMPEEHGVANWGPWFNRGWASDNSLGLEDWEVYVAMDILTLIGDKADA